MKRTPKQVLLDHHNASEPALDAVREQVLRNMVGGAAATSTKSPAQNDNPLGWFRLVRALWPLRMHLAGLAAAWLAIFAFHFTTPQPTSEPLLASDRSSRSALWATLAEQHRLLQAEVEPAIQLSPRQPGRTSPRPRSERRGVAHTAVG
jgi:hypothetical protein